MEITVKTKDGLIMAGLDVHYLLSLLLMDGKLTLDSLSYDVFVDGKFIEPPFEDTEDFIADDRAVIRDNKTDVE